jgi:hypothetical protein
MNVSSSMQNEIVSFLNNAKEKLLNNSELIPKQETPFIYSNPSDYFKGTINPIEKRLINKTVCVDTFFRSSYATTKSTDFTYTFPETINNVVSIQIVSEEIPYTWYNISADQKNNFFTVLYGINSHTITVPDGNYTITNLVTTINDVITAQFGAGVLTVSNNSSSNISNTQPPCSTSSPPQQFINISGAENFGLLFSTSGSISLGWILGFRNNINYDGTPYYINKNSYSGETIPMMSNNNYFFIDVDDFHSNHTTDSVISIVRNQQSTPSYIGNNIMARIPAPSIENYGSIIQGVQGINFISKKREYFGPIKLEKMNIRILNRFGEVMNLNQNDYSIVFEITQLYS